MNTIFNEQKRQGLKKSSVVVTTEMVRRIGDRAKEEGRTTRQIVQRALDRYLATPYQDKRHISTTADADA